MPNDGVYGSRMPADNVGHETEAVFGREESWVYESGSRVRVEDGRDL